MPDAMERALTAHRHRWGEPRRIARAPGRVNLIGEHTDYNDGFTLPMALPFETIVVASDAGDASSGPIEISSSGFGDIVFTPGATTHDLPAWTAHLTGVVDLLAAEGIPAGGWRATIDTDIPTGASLSSSAALEVAVTTLLLDRQGATWPPIDIARLGQRVENEVVGLQSGIMDQFISAGATAGHASLMDCRELTLTPVPIPSDTVVAVMDTGTRRVLADAEYDDRRAACEQAVAELGIHSLRDASLADVTKISDPIVRRRAHHVVTEIGRTLEGADALRAGDVGRFGELMDASHASLRDDYEVSGAGLDAIVAVARRAPGCLGARMTGGGFAGCAVALVRRDQASRFTAHVVAGYDHQGHRAEVWICAPAAGASMVSAD